MTEREKWEQIFIADCDEGSVETITDDDIPVQRIYSDKNIVVIKKKEKKSNEDVQGICRRLGL